jgi:cobalt-zinc-cadmium efflux system outer membrane protein
MLWLVTLGILSPAVSSSTYGQELAIPPLLRELGISTYPVSADSGRSGSLNLSAVVARVLSSNPAMRAARFQIEGAAGRLAQAGVYANPEIGIDVEDLGRTSIGGPSQTTIGVTQPVIFWGKRGARREAANAELSAASMDVSAVALELYHQTAESFVGLLGAQRSLSYAEERSRLAKEIESAVQAKLLEGAVAKSELLRAQASTSIAAIEVDRARADIEREKYSLSSLWGGKGDVEIEGDLRWVDSVPDSDALEVLLDDHPLLLGLKFRMEAREAEVRLARTLGRHDVSLSAGYRRLHDSRDNAVLIGATIPIPLFDRNRGGVAEASSRLKVAYAELESMRQFLRRDLHSLWATLASHTQEVASLTERVLPAMEQAFREIDESYRLGRQTYINVLDAQRTLAETQSRLVEVMVSRAQTAVQLESLTGHRLTGLGR